MAYGYSYFRRNFNKKNAVPMIDPVPIQKKNITVPIMARIIYYKMSH